MIKVIRAVRSKAVSAVEERPDFLCSLSNPAALVAALRNVRARWSEIDLGIAQAQASIQSRFLIDRSVAQLYSAYQRLLEPAAATRTESSQRI